MILAKRAITRRLLIAGAVACVIAAGGLWIHLDRKSPINLDSYPLVEAQAIKQSLYIAQPLVEGLYQILKDVSELLEKEGIVYWMDGETLLGAVRMGGLIPWDDDLDLGILEEDVDKLLALKPQLDRLGYDLVPHELVGYKIISRKTIELLHPDKTLKTFTPYVDIFPFQRKADRLIHVTKRAQKKWEKTFWYGVSQIATRERYPFGELNLWGPSDAEAYLERGYGPDWNTMAYYTHSHFAPSKRKYKWTLQKEGRKPAVPAKILENRVIS